MSNIAIVAIPSKTHEVWGISSEKVPHMTLIHLGEALPKTDFQKVADWIEHVADTMLRPFWMQVSERSTLGKKDADVLFFKPDEDSSIQLFRKYLLANSAVREAFETVDQFDGWTPHLTLGYPDTPAKETSFDHAFYGVSFDKIALWIGDYEGPEFQLKDEDLVVAMSEEAEDFLAHYGIKGMQWGVRKSDRAADKAWSKSSFNDQNAEKHVNLAFSKIRKDLAQIEKKHAPVFNGTATNKEIRAYNKEAVTSVQNRLQETADQVYGKSPSGRKEVQAYMNPKGNVVVRVIPTKGTKTAVDTAASVGQTLVKTAARPTSLLNPLYESVVHADTDASYEVEFEVIRDTSGRIVGLKLIPSGLTQGDLVNPEDFLAHYGVKGMQWGVRKSREERRAERTAKIQERSKKSIAKEKQYAARANAKAAVAKAKTETAKAKTDAATARLETKLAKEDTKLAKTEARTGRDDPSNGRISDSNNGVVGNTNRQAKSLRDSAAKDVRTLDDQTLKAYTERLNTEKKLKDAIKEDTAPRRTATKKLLGETGKDLAKKALIGAGSMAIYYVLATKGGKEPYRVKSSAEGMGRLLSGAPKTSGKDAFNVPDIKFPPPKSINPRKAKQF